MRKISAPIVALSACAAWFVVHAAPTVNSVGMTLVTVSPGTFDMGVDSGGYQSYLGKRGFHVIGITDHNTCTTNDIDNRAAVRQVTVP